MKKKLHELARELKDILSPHGFSRKSSTWRRDNGWCIDIIELQISKIGGSFTVNVGVATKNVWTTVWGKEFPAAPRAAHGTVESRLAYSAGSPRDVWWKTDDENWLAEASGFIQTGALPFIERMHDRREQRRFLLERVTRTRDPFTTACIAVLMVEDGEREEGCALLRDFKPRGEGEGWAEWRSEVLARMGCPKV